MQKSLIYSFLVVIISYSIDFEHTLKKKKKYEKTKISAGKNFGGAPIFGGKNFGLNFRRNFVLPKFLVLNVIVSSKRMETQ